MPTQLPDSVLSHVSLGTNDYPTAKVFYDAVLATLQIRCVMDFEGGAGYGRKFPEFWIQRPYDGQPASVGNGVHVSFLANSIEEVKAFHAKAIALGAKEQPGVKTPDPSNVAERRSRAYTLFVRAYDQCRRAAAYLRWNEGDADEFAPSLFTSRGPRKAGGENGARN